MRPSFLFLIFIFNHNTDTECTIRWRSHISHVYIFFFCIRGMHVFYFLLPTCLSFINIKNYIEYNGFPSSHLKVIVVHVPDTVIQ